MSPRLRRTLVVILLMLSGSVLTLLVERVILPRRATVPADTLHTSLLAQMDSTLALTSAQRDSVHAIFARHQSAVDTAWRAIARRVHASMDSVHRELERVLEDEQIAAFRDLIHGRRSQHYREH
jgi:hypothetical protein